MILIAGFFVTVQVENHFGGQTLNRHTWQTPHNSISPISKKLFIHELFTQIYRSILCQKHTWMRFFMEYPRFLSFQS